MGALGEVHGNRGARASEAMEDNLGIPNGAGQLDHE